MSPRSRSPLLTLGALAVLFTACAGVRLRPDGTPEPQDCPREALAAMSEMGLSTEDSFSVVVDERLAERPPARLVEGPIVSYLDMPYKQLPERSRLFGHVWTGGEMVTVRYDAIQLPGGRRVPFCAEVDDSGGQEKDPASPPGVAIIQDNIASVRVVARYGEVDPSRPKGRLYIYSDPRELPSEKRGPLKQ
jgi:hypothetical protein